MNIEVKIVMISYHFILMLPAHAAGQVCGEVGAVLQGGPPALGAEGAAHPKASSAGALGNTLPL